MVTETLIVSDPPHGDVDLERVAELLDLDVFAARLKTKFVAPEILSTSTVEGSSSAVSLLRAAGLAAAAVRGDLLAEVPWPDPATSLAFDETCLRVTTQSGPLEIPYDAEALAVYCRPPPDFSSEPTVDLGQAVASGLGPMIADAIQTRSCLDFYTREASGLRRTSIVPELLKVDGEAVLNDVRRRFSRVHIDSRLAGVRPRVRARPGQPAPRRSQRRGYSFGTELARQALETVSAELRDSTQYEIGSRLAYALRPLDRTGDSDESG